MSVPTINRPEQIQMECNFFDEKIDSFTIFCREVITNLGKERKDIEKNDEINPAQLHKIASIVDEVGFRFYGLNRIIVDSGCSMDFYFIDGDSIRDNIQILNKRKNNWEEPLDAEDIADFKSEKMRLIQETQSKIERVVGQMKKLKSTIRELILIEDKPLENKCAIACFYIGVFSICALAGPILLKITREDLNYLG